MADSLGKIIYRLSVLIRLTRPPKPDGEHLSEREVLLLFLLKYFGKCTVSAIKERLDVPLQTVSSYLKNLENHKLVSREIDNDDRRIHFISLTKTGHGVLNRLEKFRGEGYDDFIINRFGISREESERIYSVVNDAIDILLKTLGPDIKQLVHKRRPPDEKQDNNNLDQ